MAVVAFSKMGWRSFLQLLGAAPIVSSVGGQRDHHCAPRHFSAAAKRKYGARPIIPAGSLVYADATGRATLCADGPFIGRMLNNGPTGLVQLYVD